MPRPGRANDPVKINQISDAATTAITAGNSPPGGQALGAENPKLYQPWEYRIGRWMKQLSFGVRQIELDI